MAIRLNVVDHSLNVSELDGARIPFHDGSAEIQLHPAMTALPGATDTGLSYYGRSSSSLKSVYLLWSGVVNTPDIPEYITAYSKSKVASRCWP